MEPFGQWLRGQRDLRKLTRQEFADRIGCSVAMLRKMEDGERRPSIQIAELIAACLEIPPENRETFVRVARGELGMERLPSLSKGIPAQTASTPRLNLPVLPTPLIGRQHEVNELRKLLTDPNCRLLTLTGPGGIGKTRLAIGAASECQNDFLEGVYFVPLASVQAARFIVPMIADAIGFVFQGDPSVNPQSQLFSYLAEKNILLVVDNLEHLLGDSEVAEFFSQLMQRTTQVKLLVTSRETVGLHDEWVFDVQGLPMPEGAEVEGTAVELFLQRARRAHVGFAATTEDVPTILRICRLVNGMPLGIELAAAWVRTLSCEEIAREIERGLDFLSVSAKDVPARHRSMRAVFDHSWKLLSEEEQNLLIRLSVFQGGFQREAAQQVVGASLSTLSALVSKSLVRRNGTGRYDLHELVQQYASEQSVDRPEIKEDATARHGHYFMSFLCGEDRRLRSAEQRESIAALTAEIDNIRSAQEWALAHGEFVLIQTTLRAYSALYDALGWAQEGFDTLSRVQKALEMKSTLSQPEEVALAHVLTVHGLFAFRMALHDEARGLLERSIQIIRQLDEPSVLVEALAYLGIITTIMGNPAGAADMFREGLQIGRDIQDEWFAALCLTELVGVNTLMGVAEDAHEQHQAAVQAWRKTGDPRFTAFGLNFLSWSAMAAGKYEEATEALEESIAINTSVGDRWGLGIAHRGLGLVAQAQGRHDQALPAFRKSLEFFHDLGARWEVARVLAEMARSLFALEDDREAERLLQESLRLSMETQGLLTMMEAIFGLANVYAKRGKREYALRLLLVCMKHPATLPETKSQAEKLFTELKEKLTLKEIEAEKILTEAKIEVLVKEILGQARDQDRGLWLI